MAENKNNGKKDRRYWLVSYNYVTREGETSVGSTTAWSIGMLSAGKFCKEIMKRKRYVRITIIGLYEFDNKEDYNTFQNTSIGDNPTLNN